MNSGPGNGGPTGDEEGHQPADEDQGVPGLGELGPETGGGEGFQAEEGVFGDAVAWWRGCCVSFTMLNSCGRY